MGQELHHAILVTTWDRSDLDAVLVEARRLKMTVSLGESPHERWFHLVVWPDGSQQGWPNSDKGDAARDELVRFLRGFEIEEEGHTFSRFRWVEIAYGDQWTGDPELPRITRHARSPSLDW